MKIQVLTSEGCSGCNKIEKMLAEFNVKYELMDIATNPEILKKITVFTAPVVIIDGKLAFTGVPSKKELSQKIKNYK